MSDDLQALSTAQQTGWAGLRKQLGESNELYGCLPDILGCLTALGWGLAARYLANGSGAAVLLWLVAAPVAAAGLGGAYGATSTLRRWPMAAGWGTCWVLSAALWSFRYAPAALAWPLLAASLLVLAAQEFAARRIRNGKLRHWRLPASVLQALDQLPERLDAGLESRLHEGVTAYQQLLTVREAFPALGPVLDEGLVPEAATTLESLLRHALIASKLPTAATAAGGAPLDEAIAALHAAAAAALRLADSQDSAQQQLAERIADVHDLATGLDEVRRDLPS